MVPEAVSLFTQKDVLNSITYIKQENPNTFINSLFDEIYVITTTNDIQRQNNIKKTMNALGIHYTLCVFNPPSEQLYNIYEKWYNEIVEPKQKAIDRKPTNYSKLSLGELGCCSSHIFVLKEIEKKEDSNRLSLVLEDDVVFIKHFEERLKSMRIVTTDCHFFSLGTNDYNILHRDIPITMDDPTKQHLYHPNPEHGTWYGMHAYALRPHKAKQFISYIDTFLRPCDHYVWSLYNTEKPEQALSIWPPLVIQDRTLPSKLRNIREEINTEAYYFQKCLPKLDKTMYNYLYEVSKIVEQTNILYPISVVLVYFNPNKYISRKANFECMIKELICYPVSEIVMVSPKNTKPELTIPDDSRIKIIEVETQSVFFMKESLQNKGWKESNKENPYILFLDTDIVYETEWIDKLIKSLEKNDIVQAWHKATLLNRYNTIMTTEDSWVSLFKTKPKSQEVTSFKAHTGFAWAFRRDFLESIGDLNMYCVIGSGDQILARAILNTEIQPRHMYMKNAYEKFTKKVQNALKKGVGFLEGVHIRHLYHGEISDRKYYERHIYLNEIGFDESELCIKDDMVHFKDSLKWNSHFSKYFSERNEDVGFYMYCIVKRGDNVQCAAAVKKSDVLITIKTQTEESYIQLLKYAEHHPDASLFIYESLDSGLLSSAISRIDYVTADFLANHVLYKYNL